MLLLAIRYSGISTDSDDGLPLPPTLSIGGRNSIGTGRSGGRSKIGLLEGLTRPWRLDLEALIGNTFMRRLRWDVTGLVLLFENGLAHLCENGLALRALVRITLVLHSPSSSSVGKSSSSSSSSWSCKLMIRFLFFFFRYTITRHNAVAMTTPTPISVVTVTKMVNCIPDNESLEESPVGKKEYSDLYKS